MEDTRAKWIRSAWGASPTLLFILLAVFVPKIIAGMWIFRGSILYLLAGIFIAYRLKSPDPDKNSLSRSFKAGVISGFISSFILSTALCFSTIG